MEMYVNLSCSVCWLRVVWVITAWNDTIVYHVAEGYVCCIYRFVQDCGTCMYPVPALEIPQIYINSLICKQPPRWVRFIMSSTCHYGRLAAATLHKPSLDPPGGTIKPLSPPTTHKHRRKTVRSYGSVNITQLCWNRMMASSNWNIFHVTGPLIVYVSPISSIASFYNIYVYSVHCTWVISQQYDNS